MFADIHCAMAMRAGWRVISPSLERWRSAFWDPQTNNYLVPLTLVDEWFAQCCPAGPVGTKGQLTIDWQQVHGRAIPPYVLFALGPSQPIDATLGMNVDDTKPCYARYRTTVKIRVQAPTYDQVRALTWVTQWILAQNGQWLTKVRRYRTPTLNMSGFDIRPVPELGTEKFGMFGCDFSITLDKDYEMAPLFGTPGEPAYFSIHDVDSQDAWGNWGRVLGKERL